MTQTTLGIDFGTSNSAAAWFDGSAVHHINIENGSSTLPTAVFFEADTHQMLIGQAAADALIDGEEGRYMRALKSVLGDPLFHEKRLIGGRRRTLSEIVTAFLLRLRTEAEAQLGHPCTRVLSGRPVRFHSEDEARNAKAIEDLTACYHAAGFSDVAFMNEPEAAAHAYVADAGMGGTGLIVDIGGGTSDFTVFRADGTSIDILASYGIRLGGTDFDHAISLAHAMPLLGHGGQLTRTFGEGLLPVPNAIYTDLSTWAKIPFLYSRDTERLVEDMLQHAVDRPAMARLDAVIKEHLGHELAFAVEKAKIAANDAAADSAIRMGFIERGLKQDLSKGAMLAALSRYRDRLRDAMYQTLMAAQTMPMQIDSVVLVGGSSLMTLVEDTAKEVCPSARINRSNAFTAVVDGLARAAACNS